VLTYVVVTYANAVHTGCNGCAYLFPDNASLFCKRPLLITIHQLYVRQPTRRRRIHRQSSRHLVYSQGQRTIGSLHEEIARQVQGLQDTGRPVTVRWIPAHVGIPGNEAADKAAKEATGWREDGRRRLPADASPKLYNIRSTLRRWCKTQTERAWIAEWRKETKGRATYRHTPTPTKKLLRLHEGLTKRESALLVQLRTEKIVLQCTQ
jgi:hypothetical protein